MHQQQLIGKLTQGAFIIDVWNTFSPFHVLYRPLESTAPGSPENIKQHTIFCQTLIEREQVKILRY